MKLIMIPAFIGFWQAVIIIVVVLVLFGGKKIPELMKGLGQGISEFKKAREDEAENNDKNKIQENKAKE